MQRSSHRQDEDYKDIVSYIRGWVDEVDLSKRDSSIKVCYSFSTGDTSYMSSLDYTSSFQFFHLFDLLSLSREIWTTSQKDRWNGSQKVQNYARGC